MSVKLYEREGCKLELDGEDSALERHLIKCGYVPTGEKSSAKPEGEAPKKKATKKAPAKRKPAAKRKK